MSASWTWWTVPGYNGVRAVVLTNFASEKRLKTFQEDYSDIQSWTRAEGVDWDGSKMSKTEIDEWKRRPIQKL